MVYSLITTKLKSIKNIGIRSRGGFSEAEGGELLSGGQIREVFVLLRRRAEEQDAFVANGLKIVNFLIPILKIQKSIYQLKPGTGIMFLNAYMFRKKIIN
jgi:hypothetical protein